jgi:dTDP-glucose pyrophosphorylase
MEILDQHKKHIIGANATAREALQMLDLIPETESRTLFVLNGKKLVGTLTDGDIRRGLLKDKEISDNVSQYMNRSYKSLLENEANPDVMNAFRKQEVWLLPILNKNNEIEEIIDLKKIRTVIPAAALIMAGGRGERLRPLTDTLPKPMLIVGDRPIIEINLDRLISFGIKHFYISVRYLSEKIIDHLGDGSSKNIVINYLHEQEPLGTIGACSLIEDLNYDQLLVMNSDVLTNINFEDFYNYYKSKQAVMCTASIPYNVQVPYGIMQLDGTDFVTALVEKPTYTYYANAGIYIIKKDILRNVPARVSFNATDLMEQLIKTKQKLVQYPILQYWLDIGKYEDYVRAQQDYKRIDF